MWINIHTLPVRVHLLSHKHLAFHHPPYFIPLPYFTSFSLPPLPTSSPFPPYFASSPSLPSPSPFLLSPPPPLYALSLLHPFPPLFLPPPPPYFTPSTLSPYFTPLPSPSLLHPLYALSLLHPFPPPQHDTHVLEIRHREGYGMRWSKDGSEFRGFLEPQMEGGHSIGWKH